MLNIGQIHELFFLGGEGRELNFIEDEDRNADTARDRQVHTGEDGLKVFPAGIDLVTFFTS